MAVSTFFKRGLLAATLLGLSSLPSWAMKLDIEVDKVSQHMHVMVDGIEKYDWLVSTGGPGHDTPSGTFHIFRFEKDHFSKEWDNAPMPNSMFFTGQGHAIHGSSHISRLGTRASHGCVRLAPENAAILYDLAQKAGYKNNVVVIKGGMFDFGNTNTANNSSMPHRPFFWWLNKHADQVVANDVKTTKAAPAKATTKKKKKLGKDKVHSIFGSSQG